MLKVKKILRRYRMKVLTDLFWRTSLLQDNLDYNKKWRKYKIVREITAYVATNLEEFNYWLETSGLI